MATTTYETGKRIATGEAARLGIPDMHFAVVEFRGNLGHEFGRGLGFVCYGQLQVDGVLPASAGMVGRLLTQPWRHPGGDLWAMPVGALMAVLGDGTEVRKVRMDAVTAGGREYPSVVAAAVALTPTV